MERVQRRKIFKALSPLLAATKKAGRCLLPFSELFASLKNKQRPVSHSHPPRQRYCEASAIDTGLSAIYFSKDSVVLQRFFAKKGVQFPAVPDRAILCRSTKSHILSVQRIHTFLLRRLGFFHIKTRFFLYNPRRVCYTVRVCMMGYHAKAALPLSPGVIARIVAGLHPPGTQPTGNILRKVESFMIRKEEKTAVIESNRTPRDRHRFSRGPGRYPDRPHPAADRSPARASPRQPLPSWPAEDGR